MAFEGHDFWLYVAAGFIAQLVDGTVGMAFGVILSSLMLGLGVPPAIVSATVHGAECLTTGASALSHYSFGNVRTSLFRSLLLPGIFGAVLGAYVLVHVPGEALRPYIAVYLIFMGLVIITKALGSFPTQEVSSRVGCLGFCGALVDTIGGGGWGPVVGSTLIARGNDVREAIGSVNAVEFFVTLAASVTFILTIGISEWRLIGSIALGGLFAAPFGAWACKRVPARQLMIVVGLIIIILNVRTLLRVFTV
ncbi:MAG: sulfite exporter TauE/SafE family protein [Oligoflexia bacterium]|nr:sulfite exporter TauE/SafE family protein [Oligoflexia bacterium]